MLVSMTEPFSSVNHTVTGGFDDEDWFLNIII
jgi:hypothetical protein